MVMDAPDYTTARRFVMDLGIDNWNDVALYEPVTPQDAMGDQRLSLWRRRLSSSPPPRSPLILKGSTAEG